MAGVYPQVNEPVVDSRTGLLTVSWRNFFQALANGVVVPGAGATAPGGRLTIRRNADGSGAAATLSLQDRNGITYYLWVDATGVLRIGPAAPTADGSVSDTSGAPV